MMELTKERLQEIESVLSAGALGYSVEADEVLAMARQLLAGMEQEPVAWRWRQNESKPWHLTVHSDCAGEVQPLYAAPQLPQPAVVPQELNTRTANDVMNEHLSWKDYGDAEVFCIAWNACRAAMLQGAEPVSQHPTLTVWYGSMPETNGKSNWTAILHRKGEGIQDGITIDRSEYPGRVLYAADRVRYLIGEKTDRPYILDYDGDKHSGYVKPVSQYDELPMNYLQGHKDGLEWAARLAEANHPPTGDWLYDDPLELAKAIRKGPDMPTAPVQGWIPCSERMPPRIPDTSTEYLVYETLNNMVHHDYWNVPEGNKSCQAFWNNYHDSVTHWMPLPAAPHQEAE